MVFSSWSSLSNGVYGRLAAPYIGTNFELKPATLYEKVKLYWQALRGVPFEQNDSSPL
jgi:hypothetical protein